MGRLMIRILGNKSAGFINRAAGSEADITEIYTKAEKLRIIE
jgi:hypothetical protein